jgi:L-2,4-diaminobutyrate decarboxylase
MTVLFSDFCLEDHTGEWPEFAHANFNAVIHEISQAAGCYLAEDHGHAIAVNDPFDIVQRLQNVAAAGEAKDVLRAYLQLHLATAPHLTSSGYLARQFSSPIPAAAALDALISMVPQPGSFFEVGPLPNAADKLIQRAFEERLGWTPDAGRMVSTSGGSLANLTAILVARNCHVEGSWKGGLSTCTTRPAVAISADAHYSLERAIGILGIGTDQIVRLPVDAKRRIDPDQARQVLDTAATNGLQVFCLVANAGTTSTGSIDPLGALAKICVERSIWFHVDGAHAGAFIVSDSLRPRLAGIELADSFCIDAHKTMFIPAMCTLLFYRNAATAGAAFSTRASYVFSDPASEIDHFESGGLNFECTKRPGVLNLWITWAMYGRQIFERKLDHLVYHAQVAHDLLQAQPDFVVHHEPDANILCFSHYPANLPIVERGAFQTTLHEALLKDGRFFLSKTDLDGLPVLRLVIMNHAIRSADITAMIDAIRSIANGLIAARTLEQEP